jgi:hypothetical protein
MANGDRLAGRAIARRRARSEMSRPTLALAFNGKNTIMTSMARRPMLGRYVDFGDCFPHFFRPGHLSDSDVDGSSEKFAIGRFRIRKKRFFRNVDALRRKNPDSGASRLPARLRRGFWAGLGLLCRHVVCCFEVDRFGKRRRLSHMLLSPRKTGIRDHR